MHIHTLLSLKLIAVCSIGAFGALGAAYSQSVIGKTQASGEHPGPRGSDVISELPSLSSQKFAGLLPVGAATKLLGQFPSLKGQLGFRDATLALGVMADEDLSSSSARHALRVAKIEKPGGAWRTILPGYAQAAADAGRRGVGRQMFDDSPLVGTRSLQRVENFGELGTYKTPRADFLVFGWFGFSVGGKTKLIGPFDRIRRWALRRGFDRLSEGQLPWTDVHSDLSSATVDRLRRVAAGYPQETRYETFLKGSHAITAAHMHYTSAMLGGPVGPDLARVEQAILEEVVKSTQALESAYYRHGAGKDWYDDGPYLSISRRSYASRPTRSARFNLVNVQHAGDLDARSARVTIPGKAQENGYASRLVVEIGPGFSHADDFGPWLTQTLSNHARYDSRGNTQPGVFTYQAN